MDKEYKSLLALAIEVKKFFGDFYLAGGTAIMFKHSHRLSIDLDFFRTKSFSFGRLSNKIRKCFAVENENRLADNVDFFIQKKKISFVYFPFKNIEPLESFHDIPIASDYDIFLNKVYVAGRRIDSKDPFDAAFLYKKHNWDKGKIKSDFEKKFPDQSYEIYLGSILNFTDYPKLPKWVKSTLMRLI